VARFSSKIPELGKLLQRWKVDISDGKAPSKAFVRTLSLTLGVFNVFAVCAAAFLPWYAGVALLCAAALWNILMAVSIGKQIAADQISIEKNRSLFKRFQNTTRYFESILQDTSDIIISLDRDYLILKFNRGAQNHFGYSQVEIVGKPFEMLFADPADKERMQPADNSDGSACAEVLMKKRNGREITANMCVSKMRDGGFVVTAQDITERKYLEEQLHQKSEQLKKLAITDDLTALYNSRHFYNVIRSELSRLKRHTERKLAIMYMDVDKFKEYNDAEGHQMGDGVLRALGEVIMACIRKDIDAGFRYGGDEFVVILPDTDMAQAKVAAERVQNQFCDLKYGQTSLSIGIAEAKVGDDERTLVRRADFAMYTSKKNGKKRITLATDDYCGPGTEAADTASFPIEEVGGANDTGEA
jgi:diguanylate cyclase (GGDEF)-like protein/PAS domain S-box-containing protein